LPVKLDLTGVTTPVFPNDPFNMTIGLEGMDFFKEDYVKFCENEWHTIKSDPILSLAELVGQDPCVNFAIPSILTPDDDPDTILDGDEFAMKFIFRAGIEFKLIDRAFDVCSEIIERLTLFKCAYGVDTDLGRDITASNISGETIPRQIELMNTADDNAFVKLLKERNLSASTFATPVGEGKATAFNFGKTINADCSDAKQIDFPKADGDIDKKGPFKKQELDEDDPSKLKECEEPGPNCICTGFIILKKEYDISDTPEIKLSMGLGISFAVVWPDYMKASRVSNCKTYAFSKFN